MPTFLKTTGDMRLVLWDICLARHMQTTMNTFVGRLPKVDELTAVGLGSRSSFFRGAERGLLEREREDLCLSSRFALLRESGLRERERRLVDAEEDLEGRGEEERLRRDEEGGVRERERRCFVEERGEGEHEA